MPLLHWLNDEEARKTSSQIPYRLLEADPSLSPAPSPSGRGVSEGRGEGNMLIQGDNLEALKALLPYYAGQVKCIYIDPPYNTQSAFEHYDDNVEHSIWLSTMYPRLEMLRQLLSEDGSIWVSIDDNEGHYLKVLMDEVFGRNNFISTIIWQKVLSVKNSTRDFSVDHDYILTYARNSTTFNVNQVSASQKQRNAYKNPDNDVRGNWQSISLSARNYYSKGLYSIKCPGGRLIPGPPAGSYWRVSEEKFWELDKDGEIWWGKDGNGMPRRKMYLAEQGELTKAPQTIWFFNDVGHTQDAKKETIVFNSENVFATPKPERLVQQILTIATNKGDLVLDSFLGSGTTAAVAHKMGRRYIGIEMGDHAVTHCAPRLKKVIEGEQGGISKDVNWQGGGGFNFYRLGETIFDEQGHINPKVKFKPLAAHVWFSETHTPLPNVTPALAPGASVASRRSSAAKQSPNDKEIASGKNQERPRNDMTPLLGVHNETAYYLLYNGILGDKTPTGGNVLTSRVLRELPKHKGKKVIYGEMSMLEEAVLQKQEITFKHIPYDIKAR